MLNFYSFLYFMFIIYLCLIFDFVFGLWFLALGFSLFEYFWFFVLFGGLFLVADLLMFILVIFWVSFSFDCFLLYFVLFI